MADKNIFKLEGKSQEQVKEAFLEFLKIDKTKPGGYASVGSNKVICKVAKEACGVNSVLEIKKAEDATEVRKLLTGRIDEELDYGKRHQMTNLRCHVRRWYSFINPTAMRISCRASVLLRRAALNGGMAFSLTSAARQDVRRTSSLSSSSTR
ncbi:hypothetical protein [Segatella sp.]|uniref:hypothetical protein n=1 Tax=Segatella sp. TaxID=2974253 RepID=UPI003A94B26D